MTKGTNNELHSTKTNDWATRTPQKPQDELRLQLDFLIPKISHTGCIGVRNDHFIQIHIIWTFLAVHCDVSYAMLCWLHEWMNDCLFLNVHIRDKNTVNIIKILYRNEGAMDNRDKNFCI